MDFESARKEFKRLQERVTAINHALSLIFFDGEVAAPSNTAKNRMRAVEVLNATNYNLKYADETAELVDFLTEHEDELTPVERRSLNVLRRDIDKKRNVPKDKYVRYENLIVSAQDAWHKAIEDNNYSLFRPYLEELFESTAELSVYSGSDMSPYDYCLDNFEPGTHTTFYDRLMEGVKQEIIPLFQSIAEKPQLDDSCLKGSFRADKQEELTRYLLKLLNIDMDHVCLATAEHPFSRTMGSHLDVRLATRYSIKDFTLSLYTILFECAHVLFVTGQNEEVIYTFADDAVTLGIMESQTYLYENVFGRSRAFVEAIYPELKRLFPDPIANYTPEDIYYAVNRVVAGPIRIGSDEISNNLHVLVRYELEKALMDRSLSTKDLPDAWAEKYKKYLGVEVTDPAHGVLQDIHWAHGAIGHFPTAILGRCFAAIILDKMKESVDIEKGLREGDFTAINEWNREHVWNKSSFYNTEEVMAQIDTAPINTDAYIKYLKEKYSELYEL